MLRHEGQGGESRSQVDEAAAAEGSRWWVGKDMPGVVEVVAVAGDGDPKHGWLQAVVDSDR